MANVLILENPGVSTSKERPWSPGAAEPETQKEACVTDNWKNHPAYIKTSQTEKTNSGFNYKPSIRSHKGGGSYLSALACNLSTSRMGISMLQLPTLVVAEIYLFNNGKSSKKLRSANKEIYVKSNYQGKTEYKLDTDKGNEDKGNNDR